MKFLKIKNNIFKILIELFIFNKLKRSKIKARFAKKHLKEYVDCALKFPFVKQTWEEQTREDENIIWQYWHEGEEKAPELIKKCLKSVRKFEGDKKIIVLSFETIKNYVDLPQRYYDLVNSKKMPLAHFSDILRLYLLNQYGGLWIDSTIYLTDKIPFNIIDCNFFVPQKDETEDEQENAMSCFLIRAKKGSANLMALKFALERYWADNDFVLNYFMFEHISTMLSKFSPCKEEWEKMPALDAKITGELQKIMFEEFNLKSFNDLKEKTGIHKLSYKNIKETDKKTFYDRIISEDFQ